MTNNKKVVYVTGCLGFIGSYVTRACLEKGWYVRGVDKMTYAANKNLLSEFKKHKNFTFDKSDIADLNWLYDCDYIINTAAETHVDNSIVDSDEFIHSNINGVRNLLELIRKRKHYKMPILLHFSTDEVYGDIVDGAHTEKDLLKPSNPYSATKAAADQLILAWNRTYDVPYVIVRPTNNYGAGQYIEKLVPKTCQFLEVGRKISLHAGGTPTRIWLHAKDTANGIITIIESGKTNEIYNISSNFEQSNLDTVKKILDSYHKSFVYCIDDYVDFKYERPGADLRYSIDDSKLRDLGWKPEANFDEEIDEIVDFYRNNFIW
jgi:dTDP-glucose 4,6-dehydratase